MREFGNRNFKQRNVRIYLLSVYAYRKGLAKKEERFYRLYNENEAATRTQLEPSGTKGNRSVPEMRPAYGQV